MEKKREAERERMAGIMAGTLAASGTAAKLGDCTDSDLRRIMVMMAKDMDIYLGRLAAEKQARRDAQKKRVGGAAQTEARYGADPFDNPA